MADFVLTSPAFADGEPVPRQYTGDGADRSPPLRWSGLPQGTQELALVVEDPDAPTPEPWVHWLLYKIPPAVTELPEGIAPALHPGFPSGARQGRNSWPNGIGYRGPAPPRGHGVHRYVFKLFALGAPLALEGGAKKSALLEAMAGSILAEATLVGTYERS